MSSLKRMSILEAHILSYLHQVTTSSLKLLVPTATMFYLNPAHLDHHPLQCPYT